MAGFGGQMIASYGITITGIERTRHELEALTGEIRSLRQAVYSQNASSVTVASQIGSSDIFTTRMNDLTGRVQSGTEKAMAKAMAKGRRAQVEALRAATTKTGLSGKGRKKGGRNGPGRDDTGAMINAVKTNVETYHGKGDGVVTGWHGWKLDELDGNGQTVGARKYFTIQEKGSKGHSRLKSERTRAVKAYRVGLSPTANHGGVPPANSLGHAIPLVREYLKQELKGLKQ